MYLAALMQDPTVSNLCSLSCEPIRQGFYPVLASPKRMKLISSSLECIFPFYYYSVMKNTERLGSEYRDLKEGLFWAGAGKKRDLMGSQRDFGIGTKIMRFHLDAKMFFTKN